VNHIKVSIVAALVTLVVLLSVSPDASAEGERADHRITAPAGWTAMPGQSKTIRSALLSEGNFDGAAVDATASAWLLASEGGSLVVGWVSTKAAVTDAPAAVRRQLDRLRDAVAHADLKPGTTREVAWTEALTDGAAEANLEWRHDRNETVTVSRTFIYPVRQGAGTGVRQVSAECVMRDDSVDKVRPACEAALATLTLTLPLEPRVALTELPIGPPEGAPVGATAATTTEEPGATATAAPAPAIASTGGPSMSEPGSGAPPPRMIVVPPKPESKDYKLLFLIGGLLVIGGVWFAFRYKRLGMPGGSDDAERRDRRGRDGDDDALSRAAAGDGKKNGHSAKGAKDDDAADADAGADEDEEDEDDDEDDDKRPVKS
jgi:hypothetical protein